MWGGGGDANLTDLAKVFKQNPKTTRFLTGGYRRYRSSYLYREIGRICRLYSRFLHSPVL